MTPTRWSCHTSAASCLAGNQRPPDTVPNSRNAAPLPLGGSRVSGDTRRPSYVYSHLRTVHAIASCNAAEIAMGMLMEATVPTSHPWIPKAMNVQYLEKATTALRAKARLEPQDFDSSTR